MTEEKPCRHCELTNSKPSEAETSSSSDIACESSSSSLRATPA